MRIRRALLAVLMMVSVTSCTLVLPTTIGVSASSHNSRLDARRAAGESIAGRKQDVEKRVLVGLFVGIAADVAMIALISANLEFGFGAGTVDSRRTTP